MKRKRYLFLGISFFIIVGAILGGYFIYDKLTTNDISDRITLNYIMDGKGNIGYTQDIGWVKVKGYHKGGEADIIYSVTNKIPDTDIKVAFAKLFMVNPDDKQALKGKGYQTVPDYYSDWVDTSATGTLKFGETAEYMIVLKIPAAAIEEVPDKWVFQTIADVDVGGFTQVAPATWWTIDMR
jgi:hypothetical protein